MAELRVGDCVQLVHGGAVMTVDRIVNSVGPDRNEVDCVWFTESGELCRQRFEKRSLRRVYFEPI